MAISDKTRKLLWARSGNRCAFCKTELVSERDPHGKNLNLGEECHIISKQNGPRHLPDYKKDFDDYDNLILCCCNDHKVIDEQTEKYTVEILHKQKAEHEHWIKTTIDSAHNNKRTIIKSELQKNLSVADKVVRAENKIKEEQKRDYILNSAEGLKLAFDELQIIFQELQQYVDKIKFKASNWQINLRNNNLKGWDVISYDYFLTTHFYNDYSNSLKGSYLYVALYEGYVDKNGNEIPFNQIREQDFIKVQFDINEQNQNGWTLHNERINFLTSHQLVDLWFNKFIDLVMKARIKYN